MDNALTHCVYLFLITLLLITLGVGAYHLLQNKVCNCRKRKNNDKKQQLDKVESDESNNLIETMTNMETNVCNDQYFIGNTYNNEKPKEYQLYE